MADTEKIIRKKYDVPIWHKSNLTIDEAVELAKGFGGAESHKFVNGILGAIAQGIEGEEA